MIIDSVILTNLKINIIISSFFPAVVYGGPIFSSLNTAKELTKLGHDVHVSTTNANRPGKLTVVKNKAIDFAERIKVRYYDDTILDRFSIPFFLNIKSDIERSEIVHIHYIFSTTTIIGLYWAMKLGKPTFLSPRGSLAEWILGHGLPMKKFWIDRFIRPYADRIFWHATSEQEKEEVLNLFPKAHVIIIPNGINLASISVNQLTRLEYFKKFTGKDLGEGFAIISMGRLQKKKGFDILVDAFPSVLEKFPNAKLLIAGQDDGEFSNLTEQIISKGLSESIFLVGQLDGQDTYDFLGNGDLFVLPSHNENFGNVYAESLACGTPIIASLMTPWQEVELNYCGLWVENSVQKVSDSIIYLLQKDLDLMGQNGVKYVKKYDWENIGLRFSEEYLKALSSVQLIKT